jgi:hypothetical protein
LAKNLICSSQPKPVPSTEQGPPSDKPPAAGAVGTNESSSCPSSWIIPNM